MTIPFDNAALYGVGGCGAHQQVLGLVSSFGVVPPEGSVLYGHFAEGFYWNDGESGVVGDLLAEDEENWGSFDPETDITPGVGVDDGDPALAPAALALVLAGARVVFVIRHDQGQGVFSFELAEPGYTAPYIATVGYSNQGTETHLEDATDNINYDPTTFPPGTVKAAFQIEDDLFALSANDGAVVAIDPSAGLTPAPEFFGLTLGGVYLVEMAIYPANYGGTLDALSEVTWPVNSVLPALSGTPELGQTLSCTTGTWANEPTEFSYQWILGFEGPFIEGATSANFEITEAEEGVDLSCRVTASNEHGAGVALSLRLGPHAPGSPQTLPIISGVTEVGQTLSCTTGSEWHNNPISYAHQWTNDGGDIVGATSSTYLIDAADEAQSIGCSVTASNSYGSTPAYAEPVGPVTTP